MQIQTKLPKRIRFGPFNTSDVELKHLAKAWGAISLAFSLVLARGLLFSLNPAFLLVFLMALFSVGIGFLFHEMGHKFTAQKYGCIAEFRGDDMMLLLAVGLALFTSFIFAAPGAVMIYGHITRRENGIISAAGPIVNFALGAIFLGLLFVMPAFAFFLSYGFKINVWLGLFNMLPFLNFDGKKIFYWSPAVYFAMLGIGALLFFLPNLIG